MDELNKTKIDYSIGNAALFGSLLKYGISGV